MMRTKTVALACIVLITSGVALGRYSGGMGEPNDPYRIGTPNDLNDIGNHVEDFNKCFVMINDINLAGYFYTTAVIAADYYPFDWSFDGTPFSGKFDGQNHTISNLTCSYNDGHYIGLFGSTAAGSEIKNLVLVDAQLSGYIYVGAVAGENGGSITNCYSEIYIQSYYGCAGGLAGENDANVSLSSSSSTVYGSVDLGGLVGWNNGTIERCNCRGAVRINIENGGSIGGLAGYNSGNVFDSFSNSSVCGSNTNDSAGGLAGTNAGVIERCYSTGDVAQTEYSAGGLVGYNTEEINNCYASGQVFGVYDVGGLVGLNVSGNIGSSYATGSVHGEQEVGGLTGWIFKGNITNCYSTGDVNATRYVGGLSGGISETTGRINYSYARGKVLGDEHAGGLVGYNTNNAGIILESFWDVNSSSIAVSAGGQAKTTGQMQTRSTFTDAAWDFVDETVNGPNDIWDICEGTNYPRLAWQIAAADFLCPDGISFTDFAHLAKWWAAESCASDQCEGTNLDLVNGVDWRDFRIFCEQWLEGTE
ncbi:MAG: GLUG motif-containing protein [Planctomycetota bacterium]|jgi:hypothetical protein